MSAVGSAQIAADDANNAANHASSSESNMSDVVQALAAAAETVAGGDGTGGELRDRAKALVVEQGNWAAAARQLKDDIDEWVGVLAQ